MTVTINDTIERLPPCDVAAEEAVLGGILIDPVAIDDVADFLRPEHFYRETHRWIYEAYLAMRQTDEPLDLITLAAHLEQRGRLTDLGGEVFLIGLINTVPTSVNTEAYGRIIHERYVSRRLLAAASNIANLAYEGQGGAVETLDAAEKVIADISLGVGRSNAQTAKAAVANYTSDLMRRAETGELPGLATGLVDLDRVLGGLGKSELILVAARPGMGKSVLCNQIAHFAATKGGSRVALFNLEMRAEEVVQRMISSQARIDLQCLKRGDLAPEQWELYHEAAGRLSEGQMWIDDTPALTPAQLRAQVRHRMVRGGLDLVVIDYLGLMMAEGRHINKVSEISEISRQLKLIAREFDVPVLAAAQLSRAVEQRQDKRPMLSDLRDSGSLEQDADVVMFIYRDEYYNPDLTDRPNIAEVNIAKHRNGPTGTVDLFWQGRFARFASLQRVNVMEEMEKQPPSKVEELQKVYGSPSRKNGHAVAHI